MRGSTHILVLPLRIASFLALVPLGTAQTWVFQDGFENGLQNWTATGLWHLASSTNSCASQAAPFPEGGTAVWYGSDSTCTFDTGVANDGMLLMNNWVSLPANAASVSLYFQSHVDTEYCWGNWDMQTVVVAAQGGPNGGFTRQLCSWTGPTAAHLPWHERRVDLSAYRGAQVKINFSFWTGDNAENAMLGWLLDDVRIVAEPGQTICPSPNYDNSCPCQSYFGVGGGCFNSLSKSATLFSDGTASLANDTLALRAADMPPGTAATLIQASASGAQVTFGDGVLCVTGSLVRLGTQFAPTGSISWPHPALGPISSAGSVSAAGGDYFYQVIYRDAVPTHCTSATFNQTSAQRVSWQP